MLIIVEGPDGAGKTTLIRKLSARFGPAEVHHHGAYLDRKRPSFAYLHSVYTALEGRGVIMDRSWLAEPIYGDAMRGGANRVTPIEKKVLEHLAGEAKAVLVLCLPRFAVCERAWQGRLHDEYPQRREQLQAIYDGYERDGKLWRSLFPTVLYDYELEPNGSACLTVTAGVLRELGVEVPQ